MIAQILRLCQKGLQYKVVTSCVLSLSLVLTQAAAATYKPGSDQKQPNGKTGSTSGRPGDMSICSPRVEGGKERLTLLAPMTHVGKTVSARPTFAWYVRETQKVSLKFRLIEMETKQKQKVVYEKELESSPGVMQLTLPQDKPPMVVGKRYLWQVEMVCDANRPSKNPVVVTEIERYLVPASLQRELMGTQGVARGDIYAEAGFWYDALAMMLLSFSAGGISLETTNLLLDLARLEQVAGQGRHHKHVESLNAIANPKSNVGLSVEQQQ